MSGPRCTRLKSDARLSGRSRPTGIYHNSRAQIKISIYWIPMFLSGFRTNPERQGYISCNALNRIHYSQVNICCSSDASLRADKIPGTDSLREQPRQQQMNGSTVILAQIKSTSLFSKLKAPKGSWAI